MDFNHTGALRPIFYLGDSCQERHDKRVWEAKEISKEFNRKKYKCFRRQTRQKTVFANCAHIKPVLPQAAQQSIHFLIRKPVVLHLLERPDKGHTTER